MSERRTRSLLRWLAVVAFGTGTYFALFIPRPYRGACSVTHEFYCGTADLAILRWSIFVGGVFLALGDNDTYPLWYLQQAEGTRKDVTVVTVPLLPAKWYRAELARRYKLLDSNGVDSWLGRDSTVALITRRSYDQNRPVIKSPFFALDSSAKKQ